MNGHIDVPMGSWMAGLTEGRQGGKWTMNSSANHLLDLIASRTFTCLTFCMKDIHD